jgi:broad specificity phosphatase PhoE
MVTPVWMQNWPARLWLVRHGESSGNVARAVAEAGGLSMIDIADRDMDVPLSALGEKQARALGRWFGRRAESERPSVVLYSPYVRALQTGKLLIEAARLTSTGSKGGNGAGGSGAGGSGPGGNGAVNGDVITGPLEIADERLREKEFGAFHRLTKAGIRVQFPQEAELRDHVGKFYYRPPGGESWCDVILRLRSVLDTIQLQYQRERVLVVAHEIVVLCMRYLIERMTEQQILTIDGAGDVANCSVTEYEYQHDEQGRPGMALRCYNHVAPLEEEGARVTDEPDAPAAPR